MENWLFAEPGLCPADTVQISSSQRDDNRRGGEEAEGKGRNRAAVEGYIGAQPWGLEAENDSTAKTKIDRPVIKRQLTATVYVRPVNITVVIFTDLADRLRIWNRTCYCFVLS